MTTLTKGVPFHGPLQPPEYHSRPICDAGSSTTLPSFQPEDRLSCPRAIAWWTVRLNTSLGTPLGHNTGSSCGGLWPWTRHVSPFLALSRLGTSLPDAHSRVRFRRWQGHSSTIPARSRRGEWWTPIPHPLPSSAQRVTCVCASRAAFRAPYERAVRRSCAVCGMSK